MLKLQTMPHFKIGEIVIIEDIEIREDEETGESINITSYEQVTIERAYTVDNIWNYDLITPNGHSIRAFEEDCLIKID